MSTNINGNMVTSKSCSGTCFSLRSARQPNVIDADSAFARGGRDRTERADRNRPFIRVISFAAGDAVVMLLPPIPLRQMILRQPDARSGSGRPRPGSAVQVRTR